MKLIIFINFLQSKENSFVKENRVNSCTAPGRNNSSPLTSEIPTISTNSNSLRITENSVRKTDEKLKKQVSKSMSIKKRAHVIIKTNTIKFKSCNVSNILFLLISYRTKKTLLLKKIELFLLMNQDGTILHHRPAKFRYYQLILIV